MFRYCINLHTCSSFCFTYLTSLYSIFIGTHFKLSDFLVSFFTVLTRLRVQLLRQHCFLPYILIIMPYGYCMLTFWHLLNKLVNFYYKYALSFMIHTSTYIPIIQNKNAFHWFISDHMYHLGWCWFQIYILLSPPLVSW